MKIAVMDISSSALSLIVAEAGKRKTEICLKERVSLSLPHYLEGSRLSERGIEKLVAELCGLRERCAGMGVDVGYLIATAALRNIGNSDDIRNAVLERTGFEINFIDGKTEAYCDFVANRYYASLPQAVLMDIGGKSLEICDLSKKRKNDMLCFDFGLLDLHRKFVRKILPGEEEARDMRKFLKKRFDEAGLPGEDVFSTAVVVGATGMALYEIYADFADVPEEEDHRTIEYDVFKKLVKRLLTGDDRSRLILKHAPEKLYLLVPAAITMKTLFKRFGVEHVVVSESGVKEGYLYLVLHGKEQGICYDFRSGALSEHPFDSAPEKPVRRRRTRRTAVAQQEPASAEGEKETAAEAELPGNGA